MEPESPQSGLRVEARELPQRPVRRRGYSACKPVRLTLGGEWKVSKSPGPKLMAAGKARLTDRGPRLRAASARR